jgi:two-component system cell cycle sensor histidine kinase/response regulator CckA
LRAKDPEREAGPERQPQPQPDASELGAPLAATLDAIREGVQIIGPDWRYRYVNEAVCRHGKRARQELLGRTMMEAYPGIEQTEMFAVLGRCMADRQPREIENDFVYPDGSRALFELRIQPCPEGIFVLSMDITDRRHLETQVRHMQKMDAIGKLAGGIAHDFNNLLTGMKGFATFALEALPAKHAAATDVGEVLKVIDRAGALTRQLLTFSRGQPLAPAQVVDLNALVTSMGKLVARLVGEDIDVVTKAGGDLWRALIDPGAFEQVLMNLAVNARDAMPGGGCLTIEVMNARLDEAYSMRRGGAIPAGEYVMLAVSDNGVGMDAAVQEKIFEPFFTTKEVGKGTGLGLATCYGIVRQAGGHIWVYSEPGHGSTFKIYLPREHGDLGTPEPPAVHPTDSGNETVLVVEDDAQVRQVATRALARAGYSVLVASGADDALAACESHDGPLDLLLTDVVMPGVSGRDLALRLAVRYPGLRTLYLSGYTESAIFHRGVLPADASVLSKPFTPSALAERVREVLDGRATPSPIG